MSNPSDEYREVRPLQRYGNRERLGRHQREGSVAVWYEDREELGIYLFPVPVDETIRETMENSRGERRQPKQPQINRSGGIYRPKPNPRRGPGQC